MAFPTSTSLTDSASSDCPSALSPRTPPSPPLPPSAPSAFSTSKGSSGYAAPAPALCAPPAQLTNQKQLPTSASLSSASHDTRQVQRVGSVPPRLLRGFEACNKEVAMQDNLRGFEACNKEVAMQDNLRGFEACNKEVAMQRRA